MIDFRYHIVSIVAVLLALSAGVVLGSGLIGGPLLDDIQRRVDDIRATNDELRQLAEERSSRLEELEGFASSVEPYLLPGILEGAKVTIIEVEGIPDSLRDSVSTAVGQAGGEVTGTIRLLDELDLDTEIKVDELALALGSVSGDPEDLRVQFASALATRLSSASQVGSAGPGDQAAARGRLEQMLVELEDAGFVEAEEAAQGPLVPTDAAFVVLAGSSDEPGYEIEPLLTRFVAELGARRLTTLVAEADESVWDVIPAVLEDSEVAERVATVAGADTPFGRIAFAVTLSPALEGEIGHHGVGSDAGPALPSPLPSPTPSE